MSKMSRCYFCEDRRTLYPVKDPESGETLSLCYVCRDDYASWLREQDAIAIGYAYDGPYFADTMSGGSIYLGG